MTTMFAAWLYVASTCLVVAFQAALVMGAPLGQLAMGGRYPGRLPNPLRIAVLLQALLLIASAAIVLSYSQLMLGGLFSIAEKGIWAVLAFTALATILNWITPSRAERRLWAPVASLMLACCITLLGQ